MREAFDDKAVDIVSTATPNHWHALCGVWAMQAGKDAYIEKPICHNIAEGAALVAAARKYERMCQVGTQCRSNPAIQRCGEVHRRGRHRRGQVRPRPVLQTPQVDRPNGRLPDSGRGRFQPVERPGAVHESEAHPPAVPLRLALAAALRQRRLGQPGPAPDRHRPLGTGHRRASRSACITYGGRLGYQAERKDDNYVDAGDTANTEVSIYDYGDKCIVFETRGLSVDNSADEELNKLFQSSKGNKIGVIFYGSDGYLVQRTYTDCIAYDKDVEGRSRSSRAAATTSATSSTPASAATPKT